ncbi:MAG: FAD binding domain-containing protein [Spirochaetaceae bacterium]|jgi:CO/xanthine dehydrogenase FAD-binding subunit|nr:FAD binding domain-containing protein [Spirochaetaceae bacterium]
MDEPRNQLFFPVSFAELFSEWSQFPEAVPFAGGTQMFRYQGKGAPEIPQNILSLHKLEDLYRITRNERVLEIGSMVTLNDIIKLGKIVPEVFARCLEGIGGPQIRNLATIGGNICNKSLRLDTAAPLIALDAHYELRTAARVRWIGASRFYGHPEPLSKDKPLPIGPQELLTRIRIPLEPWDYSLYKKFKPEASGKGGGIIVFIIRNQKNVLADMRLVFAGDLVLRDRPTETRLIGKRLPIAREDVRGFVKQWETYLATLPPSLPRPDDFLRTNIGHFIESGLLSISD